jgi:restriction endonuclease S subunit
MSVRALPQTYRFDEIAINVNERVDDPSEAGVEHYVGLEHLDSDSLAICRWGSPADVEATKLRFRKGDIIFGRRRAYQRKLGVAHFDGICSAHAMVLRAKPDVVLPEFLPFFMQSDLFMERAKQISVGSLSPTINWPALAREEFSLPPLDKQRRIAEALEATSEANRTLRRARDSGERSRKAFIVALFRSGLRQERRRSSPIGPVPESWDVVALGDRYQVQLGKMMSDAARQGGGQVPYIRNANVQWNRLELDDVATMAMSAREREKFSLQPGDILACEGRHVGKSALWRGEIPGAAYQKALHRLRRLSDRDVPEYLLHCLQYYSWIGRFVVETGETTIPHLPAERFRAMLFPFPTRTEQAEIATAINNYDASMSAIEERIARTRGLLGQLIRPWNTQ